MNHKPSFPTNFYLLIYCITFISVNSFANYHSVLDDDLSMATTNRVLISGLLEKDPYTENLHGIQNSSILNALLNVSGPVILNVEFPCGIYYFEDRIIINSLSSLDWHITIRIPNCTTIIATSGISHESLFWFETADEINRNPLNNAKLCIYGGEKCHRDDTTIGGTIDTRFTNYDPNINSIPHFSNNNSITANNINTLIVQGINFKGDKINSDTFIASIAKNISVRFNTMNSAADAAVYLSGHEVDEIEYTNKAYIWNNNIENTFTGVV